MAVRSLWRAAVAVAAVRAHSKVGLRRAAETILRQSQPRVPIDTRAMQKSGTVVDVDGATARREGLDRNATAVAVKYRRPDNVDGDGSDGATVTWVQHENTTFNHPRGGEALWLEKAVKQAGRKVLVDVARDLRRAFR